ncbi:hypothetical protein CDAR_189061 [Caerostris darwini]|uniref:Uncharacterized protein n=1 Tax=Caerostris darwini TaxID=1538125 RepID=A0AAV4SR87_9ARAC|nr:hypothetical protein CDAR_189061 [Caerostris darwini]
MTPIRNSGFVTEPPHLHSGPREGPPISDPARVRAGPPSPKRRQLEFPCMPQRPAREVVGIWRVSRAVDQRSVPLLVRVAFEWVRGPLHRPGHD